MKMKKVVALTAVTVLAASTVMTGCGGKKESKTADGKANLKVFLYMNEHEKAVYTKMVEQFKANHADTVADIEFQITTQDEYNTTLTGMMTAGDVPDVFYVGPEVVKDYVENGYIANLTPLLDAASISTDDLAQDVLANYRYKDGVTGVNAADGDIYALPKDGSTFAYAYNKDLFDAAGLDYPDPENPYTYEEYVEVCKALTKDTDGDGEVDQWGASFADSFMIHQFIWSNGATYLSDDYKTVVIDSPEFKDAMQKYMDLTLKYNVTPTVEQDSSLGPYQRWLAGQTGFYACGTWDVAAFMDKETFPFNWDLCAYPTLGTGVSCTWNGTVGFCVSETSENKDVAVELINYLSTDLEGQKELSGATGGQSVQLPNLQSYASTGFMEAIANGEVTFPTNANVFFNYLNGSDKYQGRMMETTYTPNAEWNDIFQEGLVNVKNGSISVEDYINEVKPKMQEALDRAWESAN